MRNALRTLALLALCPGALAATWTVDDDGPAHFATIQSAIEASAHGDTILVRPGSYAGFALAKGVRVVAQGAVFVGSDVTVADVPAGQLAVLASLDLRPSGAPASRLLVEDCAGTVVVDEIAARDLVTRWSADVRVRRLEVSNGAPPLTVEGGRVEIVESALSGLDGTDDWCGLYGSPAHVGAIVRSGGELHAARCSFSGGTGGDAACPEPSLCGSPGAGASGLALQYQSAYGGARALLTGIPSDDLGGGGGGVGCYLGDQAPGGPGVSAGQLAGLRHSGVTIHGLTSHATATVEAPAVADPTLRLLETPVPGLNLTFRVTGPEGASVRLKLGRQPTVVPVAGLEEDVLVAHARTFSLGNVPAGGVVGWNWQLAPGVQPGTVMFAQATVTLGDGTTRRTNSIPIVVR